MTHYLIPKHRTFWIIVDVVLFVVSIYCPASRLASVPLCILLSFLLITLDGDKKE